MASSLSNLFNNLAEGIHKIKCKDCDCFSEYENVNDKSMNYKCLSCDKNYSKEIDEYLKNRLKNTFRFFNDINRCILLLRKGIYHFEFMDDLEKFNKTSLPEKRRISQ